MAEPPIRCGVCKTVIAPNEPMTIEVRDRETLTLRSELVGPLEEPRNPENVVDRFHPRCYETLREHREQENIWPA